MKEISDRFFYEKLSSKNQFSPTEGHLDLTYRCDFSCIHCYCQGMGDPSRELTTAGWKKIIDDIKSAGCVFVSFSGGDPLVRKDFLEIYSYAKEQGFIVTLFTSGYSLTGKIIDFLAKSPPFSIEITLNGITDRTYETITRKKGSWGRVMDNIKKLKVAKLPLILKANCLKQNKHEIHKIKKFADELLGKTKGKYHFKYDTMIYPRLNGDITPTHYRLSFKEIEELRKQDEDMWKESQQRLRFELPKLERDRKFLYHCNSWLSQFFINPAGRLRFCEFSDQFSVDMTKVRMKDAFYKMAPQILKKEFKTDSRCKNCRLRPVCYRCPARAYLETGNEEAPVEFYCELAGDLEREMSSSRSNRKGRK